ncbi:unnamed protein product [Symbiodinium sp. CCMP2592]|nr:unnamed protein product [Symbiodinium sp. CCMP2592]
MGSAAGKSKAAAQRTAPEGSTAAAQEEDMDEGSLTVSVAFIDGSELTLTLPGGARHPHMGPRSLDELLRQLGEQLGYPRRYLLLTLGSRTFSRDDWETSLEELGVQAGSHLTCVKSTPMSEALPAFVGFVGGLRTSSSSGASKVSLYFELAAEGWRDFPWRGPVDVALQATVGDLWDDAQHILMEVAEMAPPPRRGNPYDLRQRLTMLMWGTLSFKRFHPAECLTLVHCHGRPGSTTSEKVLAELRFPSGDGLKDGDCFSVYSAMD